MNLQTTCLAQICQKMDQYTRGLIHCPKHNKHNQSKSQKHPDIICTPHTRKPRVPCTPTTFQKMFPMFFFHLYAGQSSRWRHNGRGSVSNRQPHDCLLNCVFRRRSKKTSKLRVTGLCAGNSPGTGEFLAQMATNAENVSIWWRHHAQESYTISNGMSPYYFNRSCKIGCVTEKKNISYFVQGVDNTDVIVYHGTVAFQVLACLDFLICLCFICNRGERKYAFSYCLAQYLPLLLKYMYFRNTTSKFALT